MHSSSPRRLFSFVSFVGLIAVGGCGPKGITNQPASLVPSSSIWLRNTYDTDPSIYVGRFVPPGVTELDESNTMVLACSKHITTRFIEGGNVDYSEEMQVNTQVALRLGMPVVASGAVGYEASRTAQARYKLTGKLVAEIADPDAFAACCKEQPDQCTDRFVGEFIQGTGALYHDASRTVDLEGKGTNPQTGISGEGGVSRTAEWTRAAEFAEPVYFAFKINPTPYKQGVVDTCPSWVDDPPESDAGIFVVGSVADQRNEGAARNGALAHAGSMAASAAGVPVPVRQEEWCVTTTPWRRNKVRYSARVLGFVSNEAIEQARVQEQARIEAAREQARLDAETEKARLEAEAEQARLDAEKARQNPPADPATPADPADPANPGDGGASETPAAPTGSSEADKLIAAVQAESYSTDQLSALTFTLKSISSLTAADARKVIDLFTASVDKLEALRLMRDKISDPENWQVVVDGFSFSTDRETARELAPG